MEPCMPMGGHAAWVQIIPIFIFGCFAFLANAVWVIAFCKIYSRAGYPWAMGLLQLIPVVNVVMLLILAFSEWPIQKQASQQPAPPQPQPSN